MSDTCSDALEYKRNVQLNSVLAIHVLISVGGVITNVLFVRHWRRGLFFHKNSQVLIWTIVILNLLHSFLLGVVEGVHLFQHYVVQDTCNVLVSTIFCYVMRMPTLMCGAAQALVHLSIVIERAIALKRIKTYENQKSSIGLVLAVASISISFGMAAYAFKNYPMSEETSYCKVATGQTISEIIEFSCSVLFLEAVIIVSFCCVYFLNSKENKVYDIRCKYQAKENFAVLRLLLPLIILHSLLFSFFMANVAIISSLQKIFAPPSFRAYLSAVYTIPIYTFLSPLLLWWSLKHHRSIRSQDLVRMSSRINNEDNVYFTNYAWNRR